MNLEKETKVTAMDLLMERYTLTKDRVQLLVQEETTAPGFVPYFRYVGSFIEYIYQLYEQLQAGQWEQASMTQLQERNEALYGCLAGKAYEHSYANPTWCCEQFGKKYGTFLAFLYWEMRSMIVYAFENRLEELVLYGELFLQVYNVFEAQKAPAMKELKSVIYWFFSDNSDIFVDYRVGELVDPSLDFATRIIVDSDLTDLRYLYRFGEYVTESELAMAAYLNTLPQAEIEKMASTYTEGYRMGFVAANKPLDKKTSVNIRYPLGFERVVKCAIAQFEKMGLKPVIYRHAVSVINRRQNLVIGYSGAIASKQCEYDHRFDSYLFLDRDFNERKIGVMKHAYEMRKTLANGHAGPACIEVFGETPFTPIQKPECYSHTKTQQKLSVAYANAQARLVNQYIKGEERSFTIIAFPTPDIGPDFEAIFHETVAINTLDQKVYGQIQQHLIDALDSAESVHILGKGKNHTDLWVQLQPITDSRKETKFENCLADVNIPVGEVFTSPKLEGTNGVLHVTQVYLEEMEYKELSLTFTDGKVSAYTCSNFPEEEKNKQLILENLLFQHETLPMGEFAIGTNTTAYVMAKNYDIFYKLPILIAEKMGPHFAVGDTCFSREEEVATYNPDGKQMIAKENSVSALRKTEPAKAYFNCHTDITIPYDELGSIQAVKADGTAITIIEDGRFVLPGTEQLNDAFHKIIKK
jgi:hypothetical protein